MSQQPPPPSTLYHLLLTTHHLPTTQNPHNTPERLRCPGTYTTLPHALAAAHRALFDLGYERAFFTTYNVLHPTIPSTTTPQDPPPATLALHATARDATTFQIHLSTTPNPHAWTPTYEDNRVGNPIYLAIRTRIRLAEAEANDGVREHVVLAAGESWHELCGIAQGVGRQMKEEGRKWEVVDVLEEKEGEEGGELGENVVVHAVSGEGENVVLSVVRVVEPEAVRVGEASMRIR